MLQGIHIDIVTVVLFALAAGPIVYTLWTNRESKRQADSAARVAAKRVHAGQAEEAEGTPETVDESAWGGIWSGRSQEGSTTHDRNGVCVECQVERDHPIYQGWKKSYSPGRVEELLAERRRPTGWRVEFAGTAVMASKGMLTRGRSGVSMMRACTS
jgi:hypothetical protein